MDISRDTFYFDAPLLPVRILRTGDLVCIYEAGNLRYIRFRDTEVLRMIYGAVRDEHWETIRPEIFDEIIEERDDGFCITYTAFYNSGNIQYKSLFKIEGKADNSISMVLKGTALSNFKKNRIGLCVHHPLKECSGREVCVISADGSTCQSKFPVLIAPHQPFINIRKMEYTITDSIKCGLEFYGDVFETEDQRNWSDSSFKTYSTPLDLPYPDLVRKGESIAQQFILSCSGHSQKVVMEEKNAGSFVAAAMPLPKIGYCRPMQLSALSEKQIQVFRELLTAHYRVELQFHNTLWQNLLQTAAAEAQMLETKLELVLFCNDNYKETLDQFLKILKPVASSVYCILLLNSNTGTTPFILMDRGYHAIKGKFPFIKVGYGTDEYFAELNRNRPQNLPHDFVSFGLTPQVHATDTRSIIENMECQADILKTIKSFTDKAIHISPVSLKKRVRFNKANANELDTAIQYNYPLTAFEQHWRKTLIKNMSAADRITFHHAS